MGPRIAAFDQLVARHHGAVLRVCRSILRDEHLGADAAQETFLRLWRRMADGRAPRKCAGWLAAVAASTSIDLARARRAAVAPLEAEPEAPADASPEEAAARTELEELYRRSLASLSEGQRAVFVLRHEAGLPLAEIAASLGVSLPTVKTHFARACLELQSRLSQLREGTR